uniref:Uncharacterized protein n=1 Tax=Timema poppense TaxID=170557 RepID=A0A7R9CJH0_TIMPO|nr:unnamed protein product [Timema poppensis]
MLLCRVFCRRKETPEDDAVNTSRNHVSDNDGDLKGYVVVANGIGKDVVVKDVSGEGVTRASNGPVLVNGDVKAGLDDKGDTGESETVVVKESDEDDLENPSSPNVRTELHFTRPYSISVNVRLAQTGSEAWISGRLATQGSVVAGSVSHAWNKCLLDSQSVTTYNQTSIKRQHECSVEQFDPPLYLLVKLKLPTSILKSCPSQN